MEYRGEPCLFSRGDSWTCLLYCSQRPQGRVALTETKWQTSEEDAGNRGRVCGDSCSVRSTALWSTAGPRTPHPSRARVRADAWSRNSMINFHTKALRKRQTKPSGTRDIYAVWTEPGEIRPPRCLILCVFHSKLKDFSLTVTKLFQSSPEDLVLHDMASFLSLTISFQPVFNMLFLPTSSQLSFFLCQLTINRHLFTIGKKYGSHYQNVSF